MKLIESQPEGSISLNRSEYRTLIRMVHQSLFMRESMTDSGQDSEDFNQMGELTAKLLEHASAFDSDDITEKDVESGVIFAATDFFEKIMDDILDYDEVSFWEELTHRMAEQEMIREFGADVLETLDREEYFKLVGERMAVYSDEFTLNGIDNLKLEK
jgi:hypothetical protein